MSKTTIRKDKNCLNCDFTDVEDRFCPKCGQENSEMHQTFGAIVFHFFEDLTHYDSGFFKSIKYLLFNPAKLTKAYLSGKRKMYVAPIKLYFFISFITFLLPSILPPIDNNDLIKEETTYYDEKKRLTSENSEKEGVSVLGSQRYKSIKQLDSVENSLPPSQRMTKTRYWITKSIIKISQTKSNAEIKEKFETSFYSNLPKAIFIYLPIFGFWLWLFHSKKNWYFFEHAIFTFHYISFLLLFLTLSISILERFLELIPNEDIAMFLSNTNGLLTCSWIVIYFYIARKRMYQESRIKSFLKSTLLLLINIIFISTIMVLLALYSLFTIH